MTSHILFAYVSSYFEAVSGKDLEQGYLTLTLRGPDPAGFLFYLKMYYTSLVSQV